MIIDKQVRPYIVFAEDTLLDALKKISDNKSRVVFAVTESGALEGILTDGDFRRWLVAQETIDLTTPVAAISNKQFISAKEGQTASEIALLLSDRIGYIPVLDRYGHLTAIAWAQKSGFEIDGIEVSDESRAFIIAEIGNNHNGSLDLAKKLIDHAAAAGADCAKFQLRNMESLYRNAGDADDPSEDLGSQYVLDLLRKFQLSNDDMVAAFDHCKEVGVIPLCTPWDQPSVAFLEDYGIAGYKIASADLTNLDLIEYVCNTGKPIICSTGMSKEAEIRQCVDFLSKRGGNYALLHCNSTYPTPLKDVNLCYLSRLKTMGNCPVGYSGHERGWVVPVAAVALGAKIIEKHLTVDRSMEGNDHVVSLLPDELAQMVSGIREVEESMGKDQVRQVTQGELINRETLAKSLVVNRNIAVGDIITADALDVRSPGQGLQPNRKGELVGKPARRDLAAGDLLFESDLGGMAATARQYNFTRPWGIPVRYHDYRKMLSLITPDLLEFHLSYKDLDVDLTDFFDGPLDIGLVVHSPELFSGDHILDLCSPDEAYRQRSIAELKRVVEVTEALAQYFPNTPRPCIVTNVGGSTSNGVLSAKEKKQRYEQLKESLAEIDQSKVEIIVQTMPPFPWHFGGQRFHNLFVDPTEIVEFCGETGMRICFDVSHSKLACNQSGTSFKRFVELVGFYSAHLHIADASGVDGEGLQMGEGDIDFGAMMADLDANSPNATFIPEIWQGHKNSGEGFWIALEYLERASGVTTTFPST